MNASYNIYLKFNHLYGGTMDIILTIYPKNIEKIEAGIKKYEFIRSIYKHQDVENAYIYASVPIKRM
jgi:hypothetical protein